MVLPILHLNGFKIASKSIYGTMPYVRHRLFRDEPPSIDRRSPPC